MAQKRVLAFLHRLSRARETRRLITRNFSSGVRMSEELLIDQVGDATHGEYKPYGWHHWPQFPWMSYQFRRALGETQAGGGAVSEVFQAASRMTPGDDESWYVEWRRIADRSRARGADAEKAGHLATARDTWLRAADYYRSAEFWLAADDPRRVETFTPCEEV